MFAILTEHWGGKWPLWISPRQVMVVPIAGGCWVLQSVACLRVMHKVHRSLLGPPTVAAACLFALSPHSTVAMATVEHAYPQPSTPNPR